MPESQHANLEVGRADYLLYCFDRRGRALPAEPIDAEDDIVAIAIVRLQSHKRCELWQGNRLVLTIPERRGIDGLHGPQK